MSLAATSVTTGVRAVSGLVSAVTDPAAAAPAELDAKAQLVLGIIKWGSIMAAFAVFLSMGAVAFAADRGHGGGVSPEMKQKGTAAVIALVVVAGASAIVNFIMA